jgi:molecular chaperone DnaK (HSP70)
MTDEAKQGVFGIDLGTTYSAVAYIDDAGKPVIARNASGEETTPSVILFESESNFVVGADAKGATVLMPDSVVSLVKRQMGNADYAREFFGETYSAPALSSLILKDLAETAELDAHRTLEQAVITVPAYFGMLEKAATRQAGEMAGIDVIGIVPEPVAAALSYGLGNEAESKTILVYDLGGGTFDITVIRLGTEEVRVLTVDGNHELGGANWDQDLVEYIVEQVTEELGDDSIREDDHAMQEVWIEAEKAKRALSKRESVPIFIRHTGGSATVNVTREQFEELTKPRLDLTIEITKRALETLEGDHPGAREEISDVLLVGGSSKMPAVAERLKSEFGWDAKLADPDLAVAKGAALFAAGKWAELLKSDDTDEEGSPVEVRPAETEAEKDAAISRAADETGLEEEKLRSLGQRTIVSALPKAIGVWLADTEIVGWESMDPTPGYIHHLVAAQSEVPLKEPVSFRAGVTGNGADRIVIEIWEQAGAVAGREVEQNRRLESGVIDGLRPFNLEAGDPVDLLFTIDDDGVAVLEAYEPKSDKKIEVKTQIQLLDDETFKAEKEKVASLTAQR